MWIKIKWDSTSLSIRKTIVKKKMWIIGKDVEEFEPLFILLVEI